MNARFAVLMFAWVGAWAVMAAAAEPVFPYPYATKTLANGLTVVVVPRPSTGMVCYVTVVRTGSRDEVEPGRSGYAHFFEHMMFRGTERHPGGEYLRIVASLGAKANAYTSDDLTVYHLTFGKDDLDRIVEIESDRFQHLDYDRRAFQTEAGAIYGEYRIAASQPQFALEEKLHGLAYDRHTYKHTTMGFEADIKAMPEGYEYSRAFYRHFYRPENTVVLIVGDVEPASAIAMVKKYYDGWLRGYQSPKVTPEPPPTGPREASVAFSGPSQPTVTLAYRGDAFDPTNRNYVAARLLVQLAFGPQSELYKKLVLRERCVESLECDVPVNRDPPLFTVTAVVRRPDDVAAVRGAIEATIRRYQTEPVDVGTLDALKRRNRCKFVMELDAVDKTAMALARFFSAGDGIPSLERLFAESDQVTPDDVQRAARKYFVPERRTVVVLEGKSVKKEDETPKANHETAEVEKSVPVVEPSPSSSPLPRSSFVLLPDANDPVVCFRIWYRVGSCDDPPGKEGLAAVTAAMLAEGATQSNRYEQIVDKLFPLAADYAASTSEEMTVLWGRTHRDHLNEFYPLLLDAVARPDFQQADLDRIKSQTLNYLENRLRHFDNEELGKAVLYTTIFAGTGYGHLPPGTIDGVRGITLDDVRRFYRQHFRQREDVCVGLAGGFGPELVARLQRDLAFLETTDAAAQRSTPPRPLPIEGRRVTLVQKSCGATAISLGFPIDAHRGRPDWYALAVANAWFGQHRNLNGRLFRAIREARGLNYGDYSYIERFPSGGQHLVPPVNVSRSQQIFEIWIRPVPHSAATFALRAALFELKNLVDRGLSEAEFQEARDFVRKYVVQLAPTPMERLGYALDDRFYGLEGSHLEMFRRRAEQMTRAEVNAAIRKYLQYENLQIVMVTDDAERLRQSLISGEPSPIAYPTPKSEQVLAEDRHIGVFPLKIESKNIRIVPATELFVK
ncbi:MAG: insulinase family protein [Planctomycetaceae bacterium]|nr:insulinase family protein [Planctomycetaceae bacterium]